MKFNKQDKVVKAPDAVNNPLYKLTKTVVKAVKIRTCPHRVNVRIIRHNFISDCVKNP